MKIMEQTKHPGQSREKFYTVSARLVFSSVLVILIVAIILGASILVNKGSVFPILGIIGAVNNSNTSLVSTINPTINTTTTPPIVISVICYPNSAIFGCLDPYLNTSSGVFTVAIKQISGYNWTSVTVRFVTANTIYSQSGVPILSWSPPQAVNVTGGLLNNTIKYINIPITSGPITVGTNITGSIWAKYQLGVGKAQFYANISSAVISIKRAS